MTLEYLSLNFCLTIMLATYASTYAMNTIKNNIANTIKADLQNLKSMTLNNFDDLKRELGIITKAELFVRILFIAALTQTLVYICAYIYTRSNNITIPYFSCAESTLVTIFAICIIISFISILSVFTSPKQNLLSAKWDIKENGRNNSEDANNVTNNGAPNQQLKPTA